MVTGRLRRIVALGAALGACWGFRAADAATIHLGTAAGAVGIYYNVNMVGEVPTNQSYLRAQFSDVNTNGAVFNFDSTPLPGTGGLVSFFSLFQAVPNQFGLDMILRAPTHDGSVVIPTLTAYENVDGSLANRSAAGPVTWAINGYTGATDGPGDPLNGIINSLFRGGGGANGPNDGVTLTLNNVVESPPGVFTATVAGTLQTDNLVHWYNPATPNTPIGAFELTGKFFFSGTLTYKTADDTTPLIDFYSGPVSLDAEVICGTRYVDPAGSDSNPPPFNFCRNSSFKCKTLQRAIDVACPGDTIQLGSGVYAEQLKVTKSGLTLNGAPTGVVIRPSTVVSGTDQGSPCSGGTGTAIVLVSDTSGVTLNNLNVDGSLVAPSKPPRFIGISYRNASGAISGGSVSNIRHAPLDGVQNGLGIYVQASDPHVAIVNTSGVTVSGYQKNGITYNGCGCANAVDGSAQGTITGNTVTGAGPTPLIAQNGIQVGFGAGPVTISGNHITGDEYTGDPSNGTGAGILLFSTTSNVVQGNIVETSNTGVDMEGGS